MASKINIFADEWVDMVFETKNHLYGGFVLRKESAKRQGIAFLLASIVFVIGVSSPLWINSIIKESDKEVDLSVRMMSDIELNKPKPTEDLLKDIPPPPPVLRNTIKFTPPVIKQDEDVNEEEEIKTVKEITESTAAVGNTDFDKGTDDITAPPATEENVITEEVQQPFLIVEQMPEFPGGMSELNTFIRQNLRYPVLAQENGISGKVYLQFVIDKYGKVGSIKVVRGIGGGCDEEAIRVISKMPSWKPGKQGGKEVPVSYTIPVNFVLQQ